MVREYTDLGSLNKEIVKRSVALGLGLKHYYTGKPCPQGHLDFRRTISSSCVACSRDIAKRQREKHPEKTKEWWSKWYAKNNALVRLRRREDYNENPEYARAYRIAHREYYKERSKQYNLENRALRTSTEGKRRAKKISATPLWLSTQDFKEIESIYKECNKVSAETGVKHHVDHIIPLQGKIVCGLHVPWNLRVITAKQNLSKSNKLEINLSTGGY